MRNTIESVRASNTRQFATRLGALSMVLTADYVFFGNKDQPVTHFFDPNGSNKSIFLPPLSEVAGQSEHFVVIANTGSLGNLIINTGVGVLLTTIVPNALGMFFASRTIWRWTVALSSTGDITGMSEELRQVTAAGAQVITSVEPGLLINKVVASPTPITMPLASTRVGKPVRLVDWRGNVDMTNPVTLAMSGADKIHNFTTWEFSNLMGGVILFPIASLGWTIGG